MSFQLLEMGSNPEFLRQVERRGAPNVTLCYQCGKCTGGCPVLADIELSPNRIIRMIQLGLEEDVLTNESVWCCTACGTCNGRCPMGIDIVHILDTVRLLSQQSKYRPGALEVLTFYQAFLNCIRHFGRLNEIGLMGSYNINSGRLLTNMVKAPWFFMKGKISLSPHKIRRIERLERVFARIEEIEAK